MNRVVLENRHKFVYYDYESIDSLRWLGIEYFPKLESDKPIAIYEIDEGLPEIETSLNLDELRIRIFHERYYGLLIFLSIIDRIANHIDHNELNSRLKRTFEMLSYISKIEIKDINVLRSLLIDSKNMFKDGYIEYMETGKCDFYDKVPISFVMLDNLLPTLKKELGLEKYFALILELGNVSKNTCISINDYIASRSNGYLSVNILLCNDSEWKYYYANNGQFIQNVHDYTELDFRRHKIRNRQK